MADHQEARTTIPEITVRGDSFADEAVDKVERFDRLSTASTAGARC